MKKVFDTTICSVILLNHTQDMGFLLLYLIYISLAFFKSKAYIGSLLLYFTFFIYSACIFLSVNCFFNN